ncbi:DUF5107 domain-containing protein [Nonomuraea spiralis]|uniref:DUF5107 domain-containing protein n=1 Tax=Nonomuraea spiralis TaxID=46182 RepID=A0ABV5IGZ7_9ACTN|nr:DUF5107 domain-containing protein [Nonomuraea spiralis]GGS97638.1 hypothetical protein GCM10010176_046900 [Nonomuraea spiralis]
MTSLRKGTLRIEGAADPVSGVLPILSGVRPTTGDGVGADDEMRRNLAYGRPHSLVPYTRQWGYDRERAERELPTVVLENDLLTATFLPGYGGRLWSLVHRPSGRELLHRNPILQPANLALRDAWIAGGVEWNLGTTGHWPLTCEPLHAVRVTAADGTPVLRMFEFERLRRLIVRIDAWLPAGSPVLYVHVSLHNPSDQVTPVYWWSNIAVPESAGVRVLSPADRAFHFDYVSDLRHVDFPGTDGADRSYPARAVRAADYFLDLPEGARRWIAALDEAGSGLVQTSTGGLRGRKLFCWGSTAGGRHWQEWLSGPGSPYLEIQAGLARTQLEHLPMPGGATWSWTEAYGRLDVEPAAVHGSWREACEATAEALDRLVPPERLDEALGEAAAFGPHEEWLAEGSGWGGLEGYAGFPPPGPAQAPWQELLSTGRLPVCDPPAPPITGRRWREALEKSADDWHAYYHLGLMRLADGEDDAARAACELSAGARRTPWALRVLAFLAASPEEAADLMLEAHRLRPDLRELAVETLDALLVSGRCEAALALIEALPYRGHGRIRLAEARAAHAIGDDDRLRRLLAEGVQVDDVREGEVSLDRLWLAVHPGEPVPARYDFRMSDAGSST